MPAKDYKRLSSLLKHCTVAIFKTAKGLNGNTEEERWVGAWNIARARLTQLGYMVSGSEVGPASSIKFTNRGAGKSTAHSLEGKRKDGFFNARIPILLKAEESHDDKTPKDKKDQPVPAHKTGKDHVVGSYSEGKEAVREINGSPSRVATKSVSDRGVVARTVKTVSEFINKTASNFTKIGGGVRRAKRPLAKKATVKKAHKARRG